MRECVSGFLIGGGDEKPPRVFDWLGWWTLIAVNYPLIGEVFFLIGGLTDSFKCTGKVRASYAHFLLVVVEGKVGRAIVSSTDVA